ncbi:hypothetical protein [Tabrizicola sp.]|uniref:hypothetical protein n=1 Tax=Tabrizicola sp. TaxID=2005166 RepID=UPI003F310305
MPHISKPLTSLILVFGLALPAAAFEPTGIAECDDYLTKYEACLAKMDDKNRDSYTDVFNDLAQQWKELSTDASVGPMLPQQCTEELEAAKTGNLVTDFGCEF